jgi:DNA-binding NtrC family response regulator
LFEIKLFSAGEYPMYFDKMLRQASTAVTTTEAVLAGNSTSAHALRQMVSLAAQSGDMMQIEAVAGAGQAEIAKAIHDQSALANEPFVVSDCLQMADDHFAIRWQGTLFLGDIGRLTYEVQSALLAWMDSADGQYVRIITTAQPGNLAKRPIITPLAQRMTEFKLSVTPLAQRADDIPVILQRLWAEGTHPLPPIFDRSAWDAVMRHSWPGDYEELKDFAWRASRLHGGRTLSCDQVKRLLGHRAPRDMAEPGFALKQHLHQEEKLFLIEALLRSEGVVAKAARIAGINRTTFVAKLKRHGLAKV